MQKSVCTYPTGFLNATKEISILLAEGYKMDRCHVKNCDGKICFEYILEKDVEELR